VKEVLNWKATRLGAELEQLMISRARNQRLRTKPGDTASRAYLDDLDARMADRIDQCHQALQETQEALASDSG